MIDHQIENIVVLGSDRIKVLLGRIFDLIPQVAVSRRRKRCFLFRFRLCLLDDGFRLSLRFRRIHRRLIYIGIGGNRHACHHHHGSGQSRDR